jgi:hypothetical protein
MFKHGDFLVLLKNPEQRNNPNVEWQSSRYLG